MFRLFIFYFEIFLFLDQQLCDFGEFFCYDYVICVFQSWLCDGDFDCFDDLDEFLDICEQKGFYVIWIYFICEMKCQLFLQMIGVLVDFFFF